MKLPNMRGLPGFSWYNGTPSAFHVQYMWPYIWSVIWLYICIPTIIATVADDTREKAFRFIRTCMVPVEVPVAIPYKVPFAIPSLLMGQILGKPWNVNGLPPAKKSNLFWYSIHAQTALKTCSICTQNTLENGLKTNWKRADGTSQNLRFRAD